MDMENMENMDVENRKKRRAELKKRRARRRLMTAAALVLAVALAAVLLLSGGTARDYRQKANLLKKEVFTEEILWELGDTPAGAAGHAVFMSISDRTQRAVVCSGTGQTLEDAWKAADKAAAAEVKTRKLEPKWVKADVVYLSETIAMEELQEALLSTTNCFLRYGAAFDTGFETAFLEAELNANRAYDYDQGGIHLEYLNTYLKSVDRQTVASLPDTVTVFQCVGFFCDEEKQVVMLDGSGSDYGRRIVEDYDAQTAAAQIADAAEYLCSQLQQDGSFVYGLYPRFDNVLDGYDLSHHAGAVWALIRACSVVPDAAEQQQIQLAIDYLLAQDDPAANAMTVVALAEYAEVFRTDAYRQVCCELGGELLQNRADGLTVFALAKLYGMTEDNVWLEAAKTALNTLVASYDASAADPWVSYAVNEVTKYVADAQFYTLALQNVAENLTAISKKATASPADLELLLTAFETYERMVEQDVSISGFDEAAFLQAIEKRVGKLLDGWFYPEYAMYVAVPDSVLGSYMSREEGFRVRIDDLQHAISASGLYCSVYDRLSAYKTAE